METKYVRFDVIVSVDVEDNNIPYDEILKLAVNKVRTECDIDENCVGIYNNPNCNEEFDDNK